MAQTYQKLIDDVLELGDRPDAAVFVPGWIDEAEGELAQELRHYHGNYVEASPIPMVPGEDTIELTGAASPFLSPKTFFAPRAARIDTNPEQLISIGSLRDLEEARIARRMSQFPIVMTLVGTSAVKLAPVPTTTDTITFLYEESFTLFDQSKTTSQILREAYSLMKYATTLHLAEWAENPDLEARCAKRKATLTPKYNRFLARKRTQGGRLAISATPSVFDGHFRQGW